MMENESDRRPGDRFLVLDTDPGPDPSRGPGLGLSPVPGPSLGPGPGLRS